MAGSNAESDHGSDLSDAELVRGVLAGDQLAAQRLLQRYQNLVYRVCLRMLRHVQDAEDVAQEALIRTFRSLHRWDPSRPFRPWLLTIAVNRCRTCLSQKSRQAGSVELLADLAVDTTRPTEYKNDLVEELQQGLEQLRPEYQTCFTLFHLDELSIPEISLTLDRPEGTIKTWLHRARAEMSQYLQRRGWGVETSDELRKVSTRDRRSR